MKNLFLLGFVILLFTACDQKDTRYASQSPEIDIIKQIHDNYNTKEYEISYYADTAKFFFNTKDDPIDLDNIIAYHQGNDANYSSRKFLDEDHFFEMVVTDKGDTWVNVWLDWQGTLKGSDKVINVPIHLTYKFVDGQVTRTYGYWNSTEIVLGLQEIENEKMMSADEKTIQSTIDALVDVWNSNEQDKLKTLLTSNFVRTENGHVVAESAQEYASNVMGVFHDGFPDFKVVINDYKRIGNKVIITWTCTGTNTGEFMGQTTNNSFKTHGSSIWTIESDGKASREEAYFDNLVLFEQLGYWPEIN